MGFWRRLLGKSDPPASTPARSATTSAGGAPEPAATPPPARESPARRLGRVGQPGGPTEDEALVALATASNTPDEAATLDALAPACAERGLERLRVACAAIFASRGQGERAIAILEGATSSEGLLLACDLLEDAGETARALAAAERVLARDIDAPGAAERHERLRARLGGRARQPARTADVTMITPRTREDRFRILREVARGGAGVVFEAEETALDRKVAFKLHHPTRDPRIRREALLQEAERTVRFAGAGVVRLFDLDPDDGWIAYEWVARGSLRDVLRRGAAEDLLPVAAWAEPLARALDRMHRRGFVHGDLKPANVLLADGGPLLTDFGLATMAGSRLASGSMGYESEERLATGRADPADDVYAFGRIVEDVVMAARAERPDWLASLLRADRPRDARELQRAIAL